MDHIQYWQKNTGHWSVHLLSLIGQPGYSVIPIILISV